MPRSDAESSDGLRELFMGVVSALAEGDLTFPAPFDLAASAALASNIDMGTIAEKLFAVTRLRDCGYQVRITAVSPDDADAMNREIVNTTVASTRLLFALLDGVMEEIDARRAAERTAD